MKGGLKDPKQQRHRAWNQCGPGTENREGGRWSGGGEKGKFKSNAGQKGKKGTKLQKVRQKIEPIGTQPGGA